MAYKNLIYEKKDRVARLTLNRPKKLNALNDALLRDFDSALEEAAQDDEVRAVVLKGAGGAFCAGIDASGVGSDEAAPLEPKRRAFVNQYMAYQRRHIARLENLFNFPKPTMAQVHGYCLEAGCHLAMVCDITIAAEEACFGDPSVRMGRVSANPLWVWLIGVKAAKEMLFTGKTVDGATAERMGLITKAVPASRLEHEVNRVMESILLVPADGQVVSKEAAKSVLDIRGLGAAWRLCGEMAVTGYAHERRVHDGIIPAEFAFFSLREKKGLKAAFAEMNAPFKEIGF